jgi:mRNA interferase MazF
MDSILRMPPRGSDHVEVIRRGDIWLINYLPDGREGEAGKVRPGVVITNNTVNVRSQLLMTAPITSNVTRIFFHEILLPLERSGLDFESKVQIAAAQATNTSRFVKRLGLVPADLMLEVDDKLRIHLGL